MSHAGARLGLYTPMKTLLCGEAAKPSLEMKVLAGSLSGGLAAAVTSPIELIKVRWRRAARVLPGAVHCQGIVTCVVCVQLCSSLGM